MGSNQPPAADGLPPALGPRTKGPQFVLAPPPSKRRSSSYRSSRRSSTRARTAVIDDVPALANATENTAPTAGDVNGATSDAQGTAPPATRSRPRRSIRHSPWLDSCCSCRLAPASRRWYSTTVSPRSSSCWNYPPRDASLLRRGFEEAGRHVPGVSRDDGVVHEPTSEHADASRSRKSAGTRIRGESVVRDPWPRDNPCRWIRVHKSRQVSCYSTREA